MLPSGIKQLDLYQLTHKVGDLLLSRVNLVLLGPEVVPTTPMVLSNSWIWRQSNPMGCIITCQRSFLNDRSYTKKAHLLLCISHMRDPAFEAPRIQTVNHRMSLGLLPSFLDNINFIYPTHEVIDKI